MGKVLKIFLAVFICISFVFAETKPNDDGIFEHHGMKLKRLDIDRDFEAIEKACSSGYTLACKKLAIAYEEGTKTIKKDLNKFIFYVDKMCEQKDYKACELAAYLYLIGYEDITKDQSKAYKMFKTACENANLDKSCFWVARFEILGLKGAPKNPFKSEKSLKRLCQKNYKDSCTVLKNFYKTINIKIDKRYLEEKTKFEQRQQSKNYIVDPKTNLMWQDDSDTNSIKRNFKGAKKYCDELEMAGYDDWRLPNASELFSLVDETKKNNTKSIIKYSSFGSYISSTFFDDKDQTLWFIKFKNPHLRSLGGFKSQNYVRCVRRKELPLNREQFYIYWKRR